MFGLCRSDLRQKVGQRQNAWPSARRHVSSSLDRMAAQKFEALPPSLTHVLANLERFDESS